MMENMASFWPEKNTTTDSRSTLIYAEVLCVVEDWQVSVWSVLHYTKLQLFRFQENSFILSGEKIAVH